MTTGPAGGVIVAGLTILLVVGAGWFALSWQIMNNTPTDAVGEALGVMFALLIVFSVIGAIRSRGRDGS